MHQTTPSPSREKLWQDIKISLDNLFKWDLQCEIPKRDSDRAERNMGLIKELQKRTKELNAEIDDLDKRKRALAAQVSALEKASQAILQGQCDALDGETLPSKTELVRDLIKRSGEDGITREEIKQELERLGMSLEKNYVYSTLFRLRQDKEIAQKEDRYFWKAKTTA